MDISITHQNNKVVEEADYTYNPWNLMETASVKKGETRTDVTFKYDAENRRNGKITKVYENGQLTDSKTTEYIWYGDKVQYEEVTKNNVISSNVNMWGITGLAARNDDVFSSDSHGNTDMKYGETTIKRYTYDAYGNAISDNGTEDNPYLYCGENYDEETGLYYLRARYYDPTICRFMTEDPAQDGLNWYVYCGNNPVNRIDPSGNSWADFNYANRRWGFVTTTWLNGIANECLSDAENYAINKGLNSTWNNTADAYRHFLWNARLTREFGYYEARDITNVHEYNSISDSGWLDPGPFISAPDSSIIPCKMNQESFMDLWNNQVGRELSNNEAFKDMSYNQLFDMAIDNNWLITDANNVFSFLGIEFYITDYNSYTVNVYWDMNTGNITVYGNGQSVELKIGV